MIPAGCTHYPRQIAIPRASAERNHFQPQVMYAANIQGEFQRWIFFRPGTGFVKHAPISNHPVPAMPGKISE